MRYPKPAARAACATLLVTALTWGCASAPPNSLQQIRSSMASKLTVQCYWEHEGERYVFGAAAVWSACRRWANQTLKTQFAIAAAGSRPGNE